MTARVRQTLECIFFFQAEDGIRDYKVTGVQTCALPISKAFVPGTDAYGRRQQLEAQVSLAAPKTLEGLARYTDLEKEMTEAGQHWWNKAEIGRASGRERGEISGGAGSLKKKKKKNVVDK